MEADQVWQAACAELKIQLTDATFDTWLRRARMVALEGDVFTVAVHNQYAQEWLENKLHSMVVRTLTGVVGRPVSVRFVVTTSEEAARPVEAAMPVAGGEIPAEVARVEAPVPAKAKAVERVGFVSPNYNTHENGWFPISLYESKFWAPLLGRVAWRVWEIVRESDIRREKTEWTPNRRWSAPTLAEHVPCGKQAVAGVNRNSHGRQPGALERMAELGIGRFERQGEEPHIMYVVAVRVRLPLLVPVQVKELPERLQLDHDRWLGEHGFDPREWFVESV
jgi:hypothetical protein